MWPEYIGWPSLFFRLAIPLGRHQLREMSASYGQFCPVAKASEIFATRWTPLIVRELIAGACTFNDIHRGVPLIARAVLVVRLRELEENGVIERRPRAGAAGHDYRLTPAGAALRGIIAALGEWGMAYGQKRIERSDLDPALLIWGLKRRVDPGLLPDRQIVLRFEFSGVPATRTKFRIMWLILKRSGVDVCMKDPGFAIDLTLRGNIRSVVDVYLGHARWRDAARDALQVDGDPKIAKALPGWLGFEIESGRTAQNGCTVRVPKTITAIRAKALKNATSESAAPVRSRSARP
jgi:DNA-binding HxlR family transcriptional regulator